MKSLGSAPEESPHGAEPRGHLASLPDYRQLAGEDSARVQEAAGQLSAAIRRCELRMRAITLSGVSGPEEHAARTTEFARIKEEEGQIFQGISDEVSWLVRAAEWNRALRTHPESAVHFTSGRPSVSNVLGAAMGLPGTSVLGTYEAQFCLQGLSILASADRDPERWEEEMSRVAPILAHTHKGQGARSIAVASLNNAVRDDLRFGGHVHTDRWMRLLQPTFNLKPDAYWTHVRQLPASVMVLPVKCRAGQFPGTLKRLILRDNHPLADVFGLRETLPKVTRPSEDPQQSWDDLTHAATWTAMRADGARSGQWKHASQQGAQWPVSHWLYAWTRHKLDDETRSNMAASEPLEYGAPETHSWLREAVTLTQWALHSPPGQACASLLSVLSELVEDMRVPEDPDPSTALLRAEFSEALRAWNTQTRNYQDLPMLEARELLSVYRAVSQAARKEGADLCRKQA